MKCTQLDYVLGLIVGYIFGSDGKNNYNSYSRISLNSLRNKF